MLLMTTTMRLLLCLPVLYAFSTPRISSMHSSFHHSTALRMTEREQAPPKTFREAEVLGLKFMQDGQYEQALDAFQQGLKLPGSKRDILRKPNISGPSPVGGASGGTESTPVQGLDEFEVQAAHYNMACAHAQLGNASQACASLRVAFEAGFDNYATVRSDPDLAVLVGNPDFEAVMKDFEGLTGFNPFGLFQK